jgi:L-fuculose-phosphate aldolase
MSLRADVVATAREMERLGFVATTSGNVSVRERDLVHITPSALPYGEMSEDDLVTLSLGGEVVDGEREPSSERRVHLAVYAARPEVAAIVHTHSVHATAWSFLGEPLDTGTEELEHAAGGTVRTAVEAPSGSDAIARAAVEALEGRRAVLLACHGVIGLGDSLAQALDICVVVERQAQLAWLLRAHG